MRLKAMVGRGWKAVVGGGDVLEGSGVLEVPEREAGSIVDDQEDFDDLDDNGYPIKVDRGMEGGFESFIVNSPRTRFAPPNDLNISLHSSELSSKDPAASPTMRSPEPLPTIQSIIDSDDGLLPLDTFSPSHRLPPRAGDRVEGNHHAATGDDSDDDSDFSPAHQDGGAAGEFYHWTDGEEFQNEDEILDELGEMFYEDDGYDGFDYPNEGDDIHNSDISLGLQSSSTGAGAVNCEDDDDDDPLHLDRMLTAMRESRGGHVAGFSSGERRPPQRPEAVQRLLQKQFDDLYKQQQ